MFDRCDTIMQKEYQDKMMRFENARDTEISIWKKAYNIKEGRKKKRKKLTKKL